MERENYLLRSILLYSTNVIQWGITIAFILFSINTAVFKPSFLTLGRARLVYLAWYTSLHWWMLTEMALVLAFSSTVKSDMNYKPR